MRGGGRRIPSGSEKPAAVSQRRSLQRNRQRVPERPTGRLYKKLTWVAVVIVDASPGPPTALCLTQMLRHVSSKLSPFWSPQS